MIKKWCNQAWTICLIYLIFATKALAEKDDSLSISEEIKSCVDCTSQEEAENAAKDLVLNFLQENEIKRNSNQPNVFDLLSVVSSLASDKDDENTELFLNIKDVRTHSADQENIKARTKRQAIYRNQHIDNEYPIYNTRNTLNKQRNVRKIINDDETPTTHDVTSRNAEDNFQNGNAFDNNDSTIDDTASRSMKEQSSYRRRDSNINLEELLSTSPDTTANEHPTDSLGLEKQGRPVDFLFRRTELGTTDNTDTKNQKEEKTESTNQDSESRDGVTDTLGSTSSTDIENKGAKSTKEQNTDDASQDSEVKNAESDGNTSINGNEDNNQLSTKSNDLKGSAHDSTNQPDLSSPSQESSTVNNRRSGVSENKSAKDQPSKVPVPTNDLDDLGIVLNENQSPALTDKSLGKFDPDKKQIIVVFNCNCNSENSSNGNAKITTNQNQEEIEKDGKPEINSKPSNTRRMMSDDDANTIDNQEKTSNANADNNDDIQNRDGKPSNAMLENELLAKCQSLLGQQNEEKLTTNKKDNESALEDINLKNGAISEQVTEDSQNRAPRNSPDDIDLITARSKTNTNSNDQNENENQSKFNAMQSFGSFLRKGNLPTRIIKAKNNNEPDDPSSDPLNSQRNSNFGDILQQVGFPDPQEITLKKRNNELDSIENMDRTKRDIVSTINDAMKSALQIPTTGLNAVLNTVLDTDTDDDNRTKREINIKDFYSGHFADDNSQETYGSNENKTIYQIRPLDEKERLSKSTYRVDRNPDFPEKHYYRDNVKVSNLTFGKLEKDAQLKDVLSLVRPIQVNVYLDLFMQRLGKGKDKFRKH